MPNNSTSTPLFDIDRARQETPACIDIIHFNNAGSSLMPLPVSNALHEFLHSEERIGGYETEAIYHEALEQLYNSSARLLNCKPDEIAFVENATRGWDMAFYSMQFKPGDRILTSIAEYGSNVISYLQQAQRYGVIIEFVPNDSDGQLDVNALSTMIDDRVKLISMSHIPTGGGLINPAQAVGRVANAAGIPYLLDACQSVGQMPVDVEAIGCDALSLTGRKYLRGPRATGLLYMRRSFMQGIEPIILDQHAADLLSTDRYKVRDDAKKFENWEQNFAGKYALAKAIDYALDWGLDAIQQRISQLSTQLRNQLSAIDGITLTDEGLEKCAIVTFASDRASVDQIKNLLAKHKINVSISNGSGSLVSFQARGLSEVVRASVHYFNTEAEIDRLIEVLSKPIS